MDEKSDAYWYKRMIYKTKDEGNIKKIQRRTLYWGCLISIQ